MVLQITLFACILLFLHKNVCASPRTNQVILTCGGTETSSERGPPGYPGKRGAPGPVGRTGPPGLKGQPGSDDALQENVARLDQKLRKLEELLDDHTSKLAALQPSDCLDAKHRGFLKSGVYNFSSPVPFQGYCDQATDGGGWLVFQKRFNGSTDFYRGWNDYENGFGSLQGEFWLGLQLIHNITQGGNYELRVDLENYDSSKNYAKYSQFGIGTPESFYQLSVGGYSGNAGDAFHSVHNGRRFSTFDQDNDSSSGNCAVFYHGAWWYQHCHSSNLNGNYSATVVENNAVYNRWYSTPNKDLRSRKASEMKMRRVEN